MWPTPAIRTLVPMADTDVAERAPLLSARLLPEPVAAVPAVSLRLATAPTPTWYERQGKRLLDVVLTAAALLVLLPLLALTWVALRIALGPRVVLRQRRVGLDGRDFEMLKFRTMRHSRRRQSGPFDGRDRRTTHKSDDDPRHTPIGRLVRKLSLDELPQLLNVLRGDMSVVGPRPELCDVADRHGLRHHPRHRVRPGLTGEWQVTLRGTGALLHETVHADLPYLDRVTFGHDLGLLFRTVGVLLRPRGR